MGLSLKPMSSGSAANLENGDAKMGEKVFLSVGASVGIYDDPGELLKEEMPKFMEKLSATEVETLEHMNDFEYFRFLVIGGCSVVVLESSGGIIATFESLEKFAFATLEEVKRLEE